MGGGRIRRGGQPKRIHLPGAAVHFQGHQGGGHAVLHSKPLKGHKAQAVDAVIGHGQAVLSLVVGGQGGLLGAVPIGGIVGPRLRDRPGIGQALQGGVHGIHIVPAVCHIGQVVGLIVVVDQRLALLPGIAGLEGVFALGQLPGAELPQQVVVVRRGGGCRVGVGHGLAVPQAGGIHYREEHRRGGGADQHHHRAEGRRKAGFLPQFHGCTSLGRVTVTAVPTPTWLLICSVPPCTAAMRWQRARPMPLPPCLRARDLSTM